MAARGQFLPNYLNFDFFMLRIHAVNEKMGARRHLRKKCILAPPYFHRSHHQCSLSYRLFDRSVLQRCNQRRLRKKARHSFIIPTAANPYHCIGVHHRHLAAGCSQCGARCGSLFDVLHFVRLSVGIHASESPSCIEHFEPSRCHIFLRLTRRVGVHEYRLAELVHLHRRAHRTRLVHFLCSA